MFEWEHILWPVAWQGSHWLLFYANMRDGYSWLLDPASSNLSPAMVAVHHKLNKQIICVCSPMRLIPLNITLPPPNIPRQQNNFDCGVYICSYAQNILFNNCDFLTPNSTEIRNRISSIIKRIVSAKTTFNKDMTPQPHEMHSALNNNLDKIINKQITSTEIMDLILRVNTDLNPDKYVSNVKDLSIGVNKKKSDDGRALVAKYLLDPKKVIDKILYDTDNSYHLTLEQMDNHFTPPPNIPIDFSFWDNKPIHSLPFSVFSIPITSEEILSAYKDCVQDSSPGKNKISYLDLKQMDPEFRFLKSFFNHIINNNDIPAQWKHYFTTLIIKPGKQDIAHDPSSWRPLAVLDCTYRLFTKVVNVRLMAWCKEGKLLSVFQKALGCSDGCAEQNLIVKSLLEDLGTKNIKELHMCFLDLADAFGSVEHDLIWYMLKRAGLDKQGIDLFRNIYTDCYTQYKCGSNLSSNIKIIKGVKQGCPISMTLFCISINILLSIMNETSTSLELCGKKVNTLAFADDLIVIASSAKLLQTYIESMVHLTDKLRLKFRPNKCGHYNSNTNTPYEIKIYNNVLPKVDKENPYMYLGVPVGNNSCQDMDDILNQTLIDIDKVANSPLTPPQFIHAYKTFFHSRLVFPFRTRVVTLSTLPCPSKQQAGNRPPRYGYDELVRAIMKKKLLHYKKFTLNNSFLYAATKYGGAGLVAARDEYCLDKIVAAVRFLNSNDSYIRELSRNKLLYQASLRCPPTTTIGAALGWLDTSRTTIVDDHASWWTEVRRCFKYFKI